MLSSTTASLSHQPLTQVFRTVTDPRDRRGVRHDQPALLSLAVKGRWPDAGARRQSGSKPLT